MGIEIAVCTGEIHRRVMEILGASSCRGMQPLLLLFWKRDSEKVTFLFLVSPCSNRLVLWTKIATAEKDDYTRHEYSIVSTNFLVTITRKKMNWTYLVSFSFPSKNLFSFQIFLYRSFLIKFSYSMRKCMISIYDKEFRQRKPSILLSIPIHTNVILYSILIIMISKIKYQR